jgi:hypothetical protein
MDKRINLPESLSTAFVKKHCRAETGGAVADVGTHMGMAGGIYNVSGGANYDAFLDRLAEDVHLYFSTGKSVRSPNFYSEMRSSGSFPFYVDLDFSFHKDCPGFTEADRLFICETVFDTVLLFYRERRADCRVVIADATFWERLELARLLGVYYPGKDNGDADYASDNEDHGDGAGEEGPRDLDHDAIVQASSTYSKSNVHMYFPNLMVTNEQACVMASTIVLTLTRGSTAPSASSPTSPSSPSAAAEGAETRRYARLHPRLSAITKKLSANWEKVVDPNVYAGKCLRMVGCHKKITPCKGREANESLLERNVSGHAARGAPGCGVSDGPLGKGGRVCLPCGNSGHIVEGGVYFPRYARGKQGKFSNVSLSAEKAISAGTGRTPGLRPANQVRAIRALLDMCSLRLDCEDGGEVSAGWSSDFPGCGSGVMAPSSLQKKQATAKSVNGMLKLQRQLKSLAGGEVSPMVGETGKTLGGKQGCQVLREHTDPGDPVYQACVDAIRGVSVYSATEGRKIAPYSALDVQSVTVLTGAAARVPAGSGATSSNTFVSVSVARHSPGSLSCGNINYSTHGSRTVYFIISRSMKISQRCHCKCPAKPNSVTSRPCSVYAGDVGRITDGQMRIIFGESGGVALSAPSPLATAGPVRLSGDIDKANAAVSNSWLALANGASMGQQAAAKKRGGGESGGAGWNKRSRTASDER